MAALTWPIISSIADSGTPASPSLVQKLCLKSRSREDTPAALRTEFQPFLSEPTGCLGSRSRSREDEPLRLDPAELFPAIGCVLFARRFQGAVHRVTQFRPASVLLLRTTTSTVSKSS
jgi:hypothetical protein